MWHMCYWLHYMVEHVVISQIQSRFSVLLWSFLSTTLIKKLLLTCILSFSYSTCRGWWVHNMPSSSSTKYFLFIARFFEIQIDFAHGTCNVQCHTRLQSQNNTCERRWNASLINIYFITGKFVSANEWDIECGQYRILLWTWSCQTVTCFGTTTSWLYIYDENC